MSEERDPRNRGALFGNTRQREGKKDPDLQGRLNIDGTEHWISAWFFTYDKDGKKKKGISIVIGDVVEAKSSGGSKKPAGKFDDLDSDIPF